MDGEAVSFNLPSGKSTTVCAEEGTVKDIRFKMCCN